MCGFLRKGFSAGEDSAAEAEVRRAMGDYWVDVAETRALLGR
jgi:hypothetical protein